MNQQLTYVAQIQTQCVDTLWSDWSAPVTFCLECAVDDSLWIIDLSAYSANVMGVAHSNAISYAFEYRLAGSDNWMVIEDLNQPLLLLEDLQNTTTYEVRMRYLCNRGPWSDYTSSFFFTTLPPCGIPELSSIDPIYADEAQLNWLAGNNAVETKVRYRLKRNGLNTFLNAPWQSIITPDNSKILDELRGGGTYQFQMQSGCGVNQSEWTTMDEFVLLCAPPDILEATDLTYHSARINLSQLSPSAVSYQVEYRLSEDSTWTSVSTSYPTTLLQNLDDLAYYDLRVSCNCSSGETSIYSDTIQFQTRVKCLIPENLMISDLQPFSTTIEWDITGTMLEWEILLLDEDPINDTPLEPSSSESLSPRQTSGSDTADESQENTNEDQEGNHDNSAGILLGNGSNSPTNNSAPNATEEESAIAPRATATINPYADWQRFRVTDPNKFFQDLLPGHPYRVVVRARCVQAGWTDYSEELPFTTLADCKPAKALFADQVYQETARTNWSKGNHFDDEYVVNLESVEAIMLRPPNGTAAAQSTDFRIGRDGNPTETTATTTENLVLAIYHDSIQTTELNAIFEGLQPNTDYRFQVKTRCDNYGWTNYSDWTIFHTDECALPTDIIEEAIDRSTMRISWTPDYGQNDYEFKYRLAEDPGAQWVFINTTEPTVELTSLLSNQIYDYQISEVCKGGTGITSVPQDSFLMERPSLNNGFYLCGMETSVDLSNQSPLSELVSGDTIIAFDFLISITQASGGGGYFSGTGEINLPYFNKAKFAFTFDDIFVNDEYRMVGGYFEATGFGVEVLPPWADSLLADIVDILEEVDELLEDEQVEVLEEIMGLGETAGISDSLQQQIQEVVDCITEATTPAQTDSCMVLLDSVIIAIDEFLEELNNGDFQVVFSVDENQYYGFDAKGEQEPQGWYEERTLAGEHYDIAYKSVKKLVQDKVLASVLDPGLLDSVKFTQLTDTPLPYIAEGNNAIITFTGQEQDSYFLAAEQITPDSESNHIAGLLNIVPYEELPLHLVLVPLSESAAEGLDINAMQADLRNIFKQAVVLPDLTLESVYIPENYTPPLLAVNSGLLANYTQQMRQIQNAYEGVDEDKYYLFITDDYEDTDRLGFMPRGRQFGYIYLGQGTNGSSLSRTIAHEICHGAYVLEHTFEAYPADLPRGSTDNLMDDGAGTHLYKWQWDLIHNPVNPPWLEGDDAGESVVVDDMTIFEDFENTDGSFTFISSAGLPISIPSTTTRVIFNTGDVLPQSSDCEGENFKIEAFGTLYGFSYFQIDEVRAVHQM